ncbi:MAG: hypothetical protein BGP21_00435 [Thiobacillus sp. 65-29]|nr:MAG: hypothetical protein BGP21_00435 [Thiobacillus sp. 65-29]
MEQFDERQDFGTGTDGAYSALQFLEGIRGVVFCDTVVGIHFPDTPVDGAMFADGSVSGIGKYVMAVGSNNEALGK